MAPVFLWKIRAVLSTFDDKHDFTALTVVRYDIGEPLLQTCSEAVSPSLTVRLQNARHDEPYPICCL